VFFKVFVACPDILPTYIEFGTCPGIFDKNYFEVGIQNLNSRPPRCILATLKMSV